MGWLWHLLFSREETVAEKPQEYISGFKFSQKSQAKIDTVHRDLQAVVNLALVYSEVDFAVTEGIRNRAKQKRLFDAGKSRTMNSRHLTGHAVDVMAWVGGKGSWDMKHYRKIEKAFRKAAKELNVDITWGGNWKTIVDGPHFQLAWKSYKV